MVAERLDARVVLAAKPAVTLVAPDDVFLGEAFDVSVTFDNTHPVDTGYGPFVDVYLPARGVDNTATGGGLDGISFVPGSANYLGASLSPTLITFDATGIADHPFAVDTSGDPLTVTGQEGDQLLVIGLPFGSFTPDQPGTPITFQALLSNEADLGTPLNLRARSGFIFGNDPLDNPASDPSLTSQGSDASTWSPVEAVNPILVELEKIYVGPEMETATGPIYQRQYTINVDIAAGQTITDLDVTDALPDNIQFVAVDSITGGGTATTLPSTSVPGGNLVVNFPTLTGTAASVDAAITFSYFVPFRDAASNIIIIDPDSGDDVDSLNNVSMLGNWIPTDTRDQGTPASMIDNVSIDAAGPEAEFDAKSIAIQKSVSLTNDVGGGGFSGGDTVTYTLQFQISDYFALENIVALDTLQDGLRFDTGFVPVLSMTEQGATTSRPFDAAFNSFTNNFSGAGLDNGTQVIQFDISDELDDRTGLDGRLHGGLMPIGGTLGPDPTAGPNLGATTGTITFQAIIQDDFTNVFPSGDASVDENDVLDNNVTIAGNVVRYDTDLPSGQSESDASSASLEIVGGTLSKSIFAINGDTVLPTPLELAPGDTVTYRIELTLPNSDIEDLVLEDYLPLPVLLATEVTAFDADISPLPMPGNGNLAPVTRSVRFMSIRWMQPTVRP